MRRNIRRTAAAAQAVIVFFASASACAFAAVISETPGQDAGPQESGAERVSEQPFLQEPYSSEAAARESRKKGEAAKTGDKVPEGEEKTAEPALYGEAAHTARWEENRQAFNLFCAETGTAELYRREDVFWPGEKLILSAGAEGENLPDFVRVAIVGTPFETRLARKGDGYFGSLFDTRMIDRWGLERPEKIRLCFSAQIDGRLIMDEVSVVMDRRQPCWVMHRKE